MLHLLVTNIDSAKINSALGIKESNPALNNTTILIDANEIPQDVVDQIFSNVTIIGNKHNGLICNISDREEEPHQLMTYKATVKLPAKEDEDYRILEKRKIPTFERLYRGDVYQLSTRYDHDRQREIKECVIIIQNDYDNCVTDDTIAIFCTTNYLECSPIKPSFQLTPNTMLNFSATRIGKFGHYTFYVSRIKGIKRKQLGQYLGTMNNEFMNNLQPTIDFLLGIRRSRTVNLVQLQMLATINVEELLEISESRISREKKTEKILELFGFSMSSYGFQYLKEAILIARKMGDYRLEDLANNVAKENEVEPKQVFKSIVDITKKNFNFKKTPAISLIRLVEPLIK